MQEYDLSPDELIAKAFRIIQSSHPGYYPRAKKGWIAAMQKVYENDGKVFASYLQEQYPLPNSRHTWDRSAGGSWPPDFIGDVGCCWKPMLKESLMPFLQM